MNDSEARQIVGRLTSCYPSTRLGADNVAAYMSWIRKHDWDTAESAVVSLVGSLKRWPSLADFDEACREVAASRPARYAAISGPACMMCDDGWATLSADGRSTVARCPNGCIPNALARENALRPKLPMTESELARNRARLAELQGTLRAATRMPWAKPRARPVSKRYTVNVETGHAEPLPRADLD